jgi:hypothetical protein
VGCVRKKVRLKAELQTRPLGVPLVYNMIQPLYFSKYRAALFEVRNCT